MALAGDPMTTPASDDARPARGHDHGMELIAAVLLAFPIGYFARTARSGLVIYLLLCAAIFPIQTVVVAADDQVDLSYWPVNVAIIAFGIALNRFGRHRRVAGARRQITTAP